MVICAVLLSGQYVIDFINPIIAEVGGNALLVHKLILNDNPINILFYKLPNFVFNALMLLTIIALLEKPVVQL